MKGEASMYVFVTLAILGAIMGAVLLFKQRRPVRIGRHNWDIPYGDVVRHLRMLCGGIILACCLLSIVAVVAKPVRSECSTVATTKAAFADQHNLTPSYSLVDGEAQAFAANSGVTGDFIRRITNVLIYPVLSDPSVYFLIGFVDGCYSAFSIMQKEQVKEYLTKAGI